MGKFSFLKRKLALKNNPDRKKKFILIMVDALGYDNLKKGISYMPFTKKLLESYNLTSYNVGLPSTTPFVQAGLFYGHNDFIPGFRFRDKVNDRDFTAGTPVDAAFLEGELVKKHRGVLFNGSSIGNNFTGGAVRTIFTLPGIYAKSRITNIRDVLGVMIFNPFSFFRVGFYSFKEFFVEIYENIKDNLNRKEGEYVNFSIFFPFFPFFRLGINAVFREVATEAAILDMKRKVPRICVNFNGYDWVSHYRGPYTKSSFLVLKEIDKKLKWLYKVAKENGYDFYMFSDHGNVPAVPFDRLYNQSLSEFLIRVKDKKRDVRDLRVDYVVYKLKYLHENFSIPLRAVVGFFMKFFKVKKKKKVGEISVHNSSCIAHIYFNKFKKRLFVEQIEKEYPGIIDKLANHDGIGLVLGRSKKGLKVYGDLKKYGVSLKELEKFSKLKNFGDLFVIGDIKEGKIVTFEDFHFGSHDGFGLNQEVGFFVSKKKYDFSKKGIKDLHLILEKYS